MKAGGKACPIRFQCAGCTYFYQPDPSYLPGIEEHVHALRADRETALAMDADDFVLRNLADQADAFAGVAKVMRDKLCALPESERTEAEEAPGHATDLALARAEIARLRTERDEDRRQVRPTVGQKLDDVAKTDLLVRLDELTRHDAEVIVELAHQRAENHALEARVADLEDELVAARSSLGRMIRSENLPAERG